MFAPIGIQDLTYPSQINVNYNADDCDKWGRVGLQTWTTNLTYATYNSETNTTVGLNCATLASNGKIYGGRDGSTTIVVIDTSDNSRSTITSPTTLRSYSNVFLAKYNKVLFPANGKVVYVDTSNNTATNGASYSTAGTYAFCYGTSYDGFTAVWSRWIGSTALMLYDIEGDTFTNSSVTSTTGDPQNGTMAFNGKIYYGGGGGSTGIKVYNPFSDTEEAVSFGTNISDRYRDIVAHPNGFLYAAPAYNGDQIVKIDPNTNTFENVGTSANSRRPNNGVVGADGQIYWVGNSTTMIIFNPFTNAISTETIPSGDYQGALMDTFGTLHFFATNGTYITKTLTNGGEIYPIDYNGLVARLTGS